MLSQESLCMHMHVSQQKKKRSESQKFWGHFTRARSCVCTFGKRSWNSSDVRVYVHNILLIMGRTEKDNVLLFQSESGHCHALPLPSPGVLVFDDES